MTRTWAEIDLGAIQHNARAFRTVLGSSQLIAVVKADGYGHGAIQVARALSPNADMFAVATVDEALELRNANIGLPILILHQLTPEDFDTAIAADADISVATTEHARLAAEAAQRAGVIARVHVEIDTGMNRSGADPSELAELLAHCRNSSGLDLKAVWTHFACADDRNDTFTLEQFALFVRLTDSATDDSLVRHVANTGAALNFRKMSLDAARIGIGLYGVYPDETTDRAINLLPALCWKARITHTQNLAAGETVSYGRRFTATSDMRIATIGVGYADGYPRTASGSASILLHGRRAAVLGNVCMDSLVCDVTAIPEARYGDTTTLIGNDGSERISATELATWSDTIPYDVLTRIGSRVRRQYLASP